MTTRNPSETHAVTMEKNEGLDQEADGQHRQPSCTPLTKGARHSPHMGDPPGQAAQERRWLQSPASLMPACDELRLPNLLLLEVHKGNPDGNPSTIATCKMVLKKVYMLYGDILERLTNHEAEERLGELTKNEQVSLLDILEQGMEKNVDLPEIAASPFGLTHSQCFQTDPATGEVVFNQGVRAALQPNRRRDNLVQLMEMLNDRITGDKEGTGTQESVCRVHRMRPMEGLGGGETALPSSDWPPQASLRLSPQNPTGQRSHVIAAVIPLTLRKGPLPQGGQLQHPTTCTAQQRSSNAQPAFTRVQSLNSRPVVAGLKKKLGFGFLPASLNNLPVTQHSSLKAKKKDVQKWIRGVVIVNEGFPSKPSVSFKTGYQELYSQGRVEASDAIEDLDLADDPQFILDLLLQTLLFAYSTAQLALCRLHREWKGILGVEGTDNHLAVRQLESAVSLYLRKVCSVFNTEDIVQEVKKKLHTQYAEKGCATITQIFDVGAYLAYIEECVRVSWELCVQSPAMTLNCSEKHFDADFHLRFHSAEMTSSLIKSFIWPTLLQSSGPTSSEVCATANQAEQTKIKKYSYLTSYVYHSFTPVAFETLESAALALGNFASNPLSFE
eukprot:Em0013g4a